MCKYIYYYKIKKITLSKHAIYQLLIKKCYVKIYSLSFIKWKNYLLAPEEVDALVSFDFKYISLEALYSSGGDAMDSQYSNGLLTEVFSMKYKIIK